MKWFNERWENGVEHDDSVEALLRLVNELDENCELDLKMGGDGDIGETLAYFLDELVERGAIKILIAE